MILRLRQLCCHPNLVLVRATDNLLQNSMLIAPQNDDNNLGLAVSKAAKELARATKIMGARWVMNVRVT